MHVDQSHDQRISSATKIGGTQTDHNANRQSDDPTANADSQANAQPIEDTTKQVTARTIGTKIGNLTGQHSHTRRQGLICNGHYRQVVRISWCNKWCKQRDHDDCDNDDQTDYCNFIFAEIFQKTSIRRLYAFANRLGVRQWRVGYLTTSHAFISCKRTRGSRIE